jgi:hypothetical protein
MIARIGKTALRLYANSLLWFTVGVTAGGIYVAFLLIMWGAVR